MSSSGVEGTEGVPIDDGGHQSAKPCARYSHFGRPFGWATKYPCRKQRLTEFCGLGGLCVRDHKQDPRFGWTPVIACPMILSSVLTATFKTWALSGVTAKLERHPTLAGPHVPKTCLRTGSACILYSSKQRSLTRQRLLLRRLRVRFEHVPLISDASTSTCRPRPFSDPTSSRICGSGVRSSRV